MGGRAEIRATPTTSPLAPSPPGGRRKERGREGTTGGLEVGVRGVTKRERHFFLAVGGGIYQPGRANTSSQSKSAFYEEGN